MKKRVVTPRSLAVLQLCINERDFCINERDLTRFIWKIETDIEIKCMSSITSNSDIPVTPTIPWSGGRVSNFLCYII